jgi:hypothetical protein
MTATTVAFERGDRVRHVPTGKVGVVEGPAPQEHFPGWWDVTVQGDDWPGQVWHQEYLALVGAGAERRLTQTVANDQLARVRRLLRGLGR